MNHEAPSPPNAEVYLMVRNGDESGVSGTGPVCMVFVLPSGRCITEWLVPPYNMGVYLNKEAFEETHILSHPLNGTELIPFILQLAKDTHETPEEGFPG